MPSNRYTHDWTDEETDTLRQCWADGMKVSHIVRRVGAGVTKAAVIAKADRLGLGNHPNAMPPDRYNQSSYRWGPRQVPTEPIDKKLAHMEARDREKLIKMPQLSFQSHRLPGEPQSVDARWK